MKELAIYLFGSSKRIEKVSACQIFCWTRVTRILQKSVFTKITRWSPSDAVAPGLARHRNGSVLLCAVPLRVRPSSPATDAR